MSRSYSDSVTVSSSSTASPAAILDPTSPRSELSTIGNGASSSSSSASSSASASTSSSAFTTTASSRATSSSSWSCGRREITIVIVLITLATNALVVTGWSAMLPVLVGDGVYFELCEGNELFTENSRGLNITSCTEQRVQLSLVATFALTTINIAAPVFGVINDLVSPRVPTVVSVVCMATAYLLLAFANSQTFDVYILAFSLLGLGGGALIISTAHLSNLFPRHRAILMMILVATAQVSNFVFYLGQVLYFSAGLSFRTIMLLFLVFPLLNVVMVFLQPKKVILSTSSPSPAPPPKGKALVDIDDDLIVDDDEVSMKKGKKSKSKSKKKQGNLGSGQKEGESSSSYNMTSEDRSGTSGDSSSSDTGAVSGGVTISPSLSEEESVVDEPANHMEIFSYTFPTFMSVITSLPFWVLIGWMGITVSTTYFYLSNLEYQLEWTLDSLEDAQRGAVIYSIIFIFTPLLVVPITGLLTQKFGTYVGCIGTCVLFAVFYIVLFVPVFEIQVINFFVFIVARSSVFGINSHFANVMFGRYFSRVLGLSLAAGGLFTLLNFLWTWLTLVVLDGEFGYIVVPMAILTVASTAGLALMTRRWRMPGVNM